MIWLHYLITFYLMELHIGIISFFIDTLPKTYWLFINMTIYWRWIPSNKYTPNFNICAPQISLVYLIHQYISGPSNSQWEDVDGASYDHRTANVNVNADATKDPPIHEENKAGWSYIYEL